MARLRTRRRSPVVAVAALVLLLASCISPLYERGAIKSGVTATGGLGVAYTGEPSVDLPATSCLIGLATARLEYGFGGPSASTRTGYSVVAQASCGTGAWLSDEHPDRLPLVYDFRAGAKRGLSANSALLMTIGFPTLANAYWIEDIDRRLTVCVGLGLNGITVGLTSHHQLPGGLVVHPTVSVVGGLVSFGDRVKSLAAHAGVGVETP